MAAWGVSVDGIASLVQETKSKLKFSSKDGLIEFIVQRMGYRVLSTGSATTTWRNTITGLIMAIVHSDGCPFCGDAFREVYAQRGFSAKVFQLTWDPRTDEQVLPGDFLKSYWYILGSFASGDFRCVFTPLPSRVIKIFKSLTSPDALHGVDTLQFLSSVRCMLESFPKDCFMQKIVEWLPKAAGLASYTEEQIHSMTYGFACTDPERAFLLCQTSYDDWIRFAVARYDTTEEEVDDFWNNRPSVVDGATSVWAHPLIRKMARVDYAFLPDAQAQSASAYGSG